VLKVAFSQPYPLFSGLWSTPKRGHLYPYLQSAVHRQGLFAVQIATAAQKRNIAKSMLQAYKAHQLNCTAVAAKRHCSQSKVKGQGFSEVWIRLTKSGFGWSLGLNFAQPIVTYQHPGSATVSQQAWLGQLCMKWHLH
jgi:hypothetical protein